MSALNNQTNINTNRFFFATAEDGEQTLFLSTSVLYPGVSTLSVGITGAQGNEVVVSQAPNYIATDFLGADQGLTVGAASDYWTLSTIGVNQAGFSLGVDRKPGSGTVSLESYGTNGFPGGFEFLCRGLSSQMVSTNQTYMNNYLSSIGAPGATALLQPTGALNVSLGITTPFYTALGPPNVPGGKSCYGIQDLSGATGTTRIPRWTIGTVDNATGNNTGTNFALFAFDDVGVFNNSPLKIQRANGEMLIQNISSIQNQVSTATYASVFPCTKDNTEFGIGGANNTKAITGVPTVLFSTLVSGLNPNTQSLVNINFANALSTASNFVEYKVGFSTATAYTNILQTAYLPGGGWTPGGAPSTIGNTNICCIVDPDGLNPNGTGTLYVAGRTLNGLADTIYLEKGPITEPTRNALCYRPV